MLLVDPLKRITIPEIRWAVLLTLRSLAVGWPRSLFQLLIRVGLYGICLNFSRATPSHHTLLRSLCAPAGSTPGLQCTCRGTWRSCRRVYLLAGEGRWAAPQAHMLARVATARLGQRCCNALGRLLLHLYCSFTTCCSICPAAGGPGGGRHPHRRGDCAGRCAARCAASCACAANWLVLPPDWLCMTCKCLCRCL